MYLNVKEIYNELNKTPHMSYSELQTKIMNEVSATYKKYLNDKEEERKKKEEAEKREKEIDNAEKELLNSLEKYCKLTETDQLFEAFKNIFF